MDKIQTQRYALICISLIISSLHRVQNDMWKVHAKMAYSGLREPCKKYSKLTHAHIHTERMVDYVLH